MAVVAPAVPLRLTSAPLKPLTPSLKTATKLIGLVLVGSAWPAAWLIVTVSGVALNVTVLSVLVEAALVFVAASMAPPAGILAVHGAEGDMPLTAGGQAGASIGVVLGAE